MTDQTPPYRSRLDNHILEDRFAKVEALRETGTNPFPNGFNITATAEELFAAYGLMSHEELTAEPLHVEIAGRLRFARWMGKASFMKIQDRSVRAGIKPAWGDTENTDDFLQLFVLRSEKSQQTTQGVVLLALQQQQSRQFLEYDLRQFDCDQRYQSK